ncbi:MAG: alpha/beta fold hydrolase [Propionibacteriaceae bacterium]|nr:alpha/beta fold hydrolase [Propionibacteriaceae bacterium]
MFYRCGAKTLADKGYRVVMFDLRGHGLSDSSDWGYGLSDMTQDLFDVMDALGIDTAHLVGYSVGAVIALKAMLMCPDRISSLVLIETFGMKQSDLDTMPSDQEGIDRSFDIYVAATGLKLTDKQKGDYQQRVEALAQAGARESLMEDVDFITNEKLDTIHKPVLFLGGKQSPYRDDQILAASRVPGAQLKMVKTGHYLPLTQEAWLKHHLVSFFPDPAPVQSHRLFAHHADDPNDLEGFWEHADAATEQPAIRIDGLCVSYGDVQAVKGISFSVEEGAFFAFLGINGAGKSSTIKCLTTLRRPSGGQAMVAGHLLGRDNEAIRRSIGVVFQSALLDPRLSVKENLHVRARLHGLDRHIRDDRIDELVTLLEMGGFIDQQYRHLSGGQQRRADIARALIHKPDILFLDEPTAGLDPHGREQVWQAISDVRDHEGMTVFLTTHYMEETEKADMVCIIDAGEIVVQGTPEYLRHRFASSHLSVRFLDEATGVKRLAKFFPEVELSPGHAPGDPVRFPVESTDKVKWMLPYIWDQIEDFEFRHGSMDDVFLQLTGHSGDGMTTADDAGGSRGTRPRGGKGSVAQ